MMISTAVSLKGDDWGEAFETEYDFMYREIKEKRKKKKLSKKII